MPRGWIVRASKDDQNCDLQDHQISHSVTSSGRVTSKMPRKIADIRARSIAAVNIVANVHVDASGERLRLRSCGCVLCTPWYKHRRCAGVENAM